MPRAVIMKVLGCFPRIELSVPWHDGPQGILLPSQIFPWLESLCGQGHFFGTLRRKGGHAQVFSQIAMQKRVAELLYLIVDGTSGSQARPPGGIPGDKEEEHKLLIDVSHPPPMVPSDQNLAQTTLRRIPCSKKGSSDSSSCHRWRVMLSSFNAGDIKEDRADGFVVGPLANRVGYCFDLKFPELTSLLYGVRLGTLQEDGKSFLSIPEQDVDVLQRNGWRICAHACDELPQNPAQLQCFSDATATANGNAGGKRNSKNKNDEPCTFCESEKGSSLVQESSAPRKGGGEGEGEGEEEDKLWIWLVAGGCGILTTLFMAVADGNGLPKWRSRAAKEAQQPSSI